MVKSKSLLFLQNVLIGANNILKLSDFGIAKHLQDLKTGTFAGALRYMAPEIKSGVPYNEKCDVWSLGILILELCFLRLEDTEVNRISSRYRLLSSNTWLCLKMCIHIFKHNMLMLVSIVGSCV